MLAAIEISIEIEIEVERRLPNKALYRSFSVPYTSEKVQIIWL